MGALVSAIAFPHPDKNISSNALQKRRDLVFLKTSQGDKIPAIHIQRKDSPLTILYSHGNAEDVGISLPYLDHMSEVCKISVLAYEYPGYSIAEGEPSEENCYLAINAAYQYLINNCGLSPCDIVLFGRSLGTGPTVDLCSRASPQVAGCILQSPLESGIRAFLGTYTSRALYYLDIFRSYEKVNDITCPVFIIHGQEDEVVPCVNGRKLYAKLQTRPCHEDVAYEPLWIPLHGHNDMPEYQCLGRCRDFLQFLEMRRKEATAGEM